MSDLVRAEISDAVSAVPGISCDPYYRQGTKVGDASVQYVGTEYPNPFGGIRTWRVVLNVHQDNRAAEIYMDEKLPLLLAALEPVLTVRRAAPITQVFPDGTSTSALAIEGTREE